MLKEKIGYSGIDSQKVLLLGMFPNTEVLSSLPPEIF
jgi:hypothetical protein